MGCTLPILVEQRSPNLSVAEIKDKHPEYYELAARHRKSETWKPTPSPTTNRYERDRAFDGDCLQPLSYIQREWYAIDIPHQLGLVSDIYHGHKGLGLQLAKASGWGPGPSEWMRKIMDVKGYPRLLALQMLCTVFGALDEFMKHHRSRTLHTKVYHCFRIKAREWDKNRFVFFPAVDKLTVSLVSDVADTIVSDILPRAVSDLKKKEMLEFKKQKKEAVAKQQARTQKEAAKLKCRIAEIDGVLGHD